MNETPLPAGEVRPSVKSFAICMEMVLRRHDAAKGTQPDWRKLRPAELLAKLKQKIEEVEHELGLSVGTDEAAARIAIDIGNYAFFLADVLQPLAKDPSEDDLAVASAMSGAPVIGMNDEFRHPNPRPLALVHGDGETDAATS